MANDFSGDSRCKALWKLENGALTSDSKGTNTLTAVNSPAADTVNKQEGGASVVLSGANSFSIPNANLDAGFPFKNGDTTKKITICNWFKQTTATTNNWLYCFGNAYNNAFSWGIELYWQALYIFSSHLGNNAVAQISAGFTFTLNRWYHIAVTLDGVNKLLTVRVWDSVSQTIVYTASVGINDTVYVGTGNIVIGEGDGGWIGNIDEVVVFNDLLTDAEIDAIRAGTFPPSPLPVNNFTTDPNCVALWKFEAGALVTDSIGTNTLTNSGVDEDAANFKEGACAAKFVLANADYMYRADAGLSAGFPLKSGDTSKKYSVAFWIKFSSLAAQMDIFNKGPVSGGNIQLEITAAGVLTLSYGLSNWAVATLVSGRWYHIGISGDGVAKTATVRIWDDIAGAAATYTNTFGATLGVDTAAFQLGKSWWAASPLDALLDEFAVFKDELTVAETDLIRAGNYGTPLLAGTIVGVSTLQGNITGVSTLLGGTVAAVSSVTGAMTGGSLALGSAVVAAVSAVSAVTLTTVAGPVPVVLIPTGGFVMGGAGVWASSTPVDTDLSAIADAEPTGYYLGGGAAAGEDEVISTIPGADAIVSEGGGFVFCGPGTTGNATTSEPAQDVIEDVVGFVMGGAGTWGQVAPADIPRAVLVPTGGFVLSGSGFSLDPGITPTSTLIVSTGGWVLGRFGSPPIEVTYPGGADRIIDEVVALALGGAGVWGGSTPVITAIIDTGGFVLGRSGLPPIEVTYPAIDRIIEEIIALEMGGEGVWGGSTPDTTIIVSQGAIFALSGGSGPATVKSPPIAVITGDATGGFVMGGTGWPLAAEVYEAWVLSGQAFEPSVWSAFNFNSFAVKGGQAYACGDAGIYLLGGDHDAGEAIQTGARIGPVNFGADRDKRIRGIQYGQGGKNTRVRVKSENGDVGIFEPDRDENRVVVSRDIQGREFTIDIMNFDELSQCEIFPLRLARR